MSEQRYVAIDFDAVISRYTGWDGKHRFGELLPGVAIALKEIHESGAVIIINTCRLDIDEVAEYLKLHYIHFDHINCSPLTEKLFLHPAKVMAHAYVDDR